MSDWYRFQSQFYETTSERNERLRRRREQRRVQEAVPLTNQPAQAGDAAQVPGEGSRDDQ